MKKIGLLAIIIAGLALVTGGLAQERVEVLEVPLSDFVLEAPEEVTAKRPPVPFPHPRHFGFSCKDCHHTWDGYTEIQSCMASGCHDQVKGDPSVTDLVERERAINIYRVAYHKMCTGCHKSISMENKKRKKAGEELLANGPRKCSACHVKQAD